MSLQHYVLFNNHLTGMQLYKQLKEFGIRTVIAPTPRSLSRCCGISLLVNGDDVEAIRLYVKEHEIEIIDIASIENTHDIHRDKYC